MYKHLTLYYLLIWMTVSQAALSQGERFSFLASEDGVINPIYGKYQDASQYPDMLPIHGNKKILLARTEVTVYQYRLFCEATKRDMPPKMPSWGWRENHPIVYVSIDDAKAYCQWLSQETGHNYRLPTISEWEQAAGNQTNLNALDKHAWFDVNTHLKTTNTVATKAPNINGIYDLQGNVWEWCSNHTSEQNAPIKGGSWSRSSAALSVQKTEWVPTKVKAIDIGFRPVLELK